MAAAKSGRYPARDATLVVVAYRHGLRASELCDLEWSQVEFGRSARPCTSAALRTASPLRIPFVGMGCGRVVPYELLLGHPLTAC